MSYSTPRTEYEIKARELADAYVAKQEAKSGFLGAAERTLVDIFVKDYSSILSLSKINKLACAHLCGDLKFGEMQALLTQMSRAKFIRRSKRRLLSGEVAYEVRY